MDVRIKWKMNRVRAWQANDQVAIALWISGFPSGHSSAGYFNDDSRRTGTWGNTRGRIGKSANECGILRLQEDASLRLTRLLLCFEILNTKILNKYTRGGASLFETFIDVSKVWMINQRTREMDEDKEHFFPYWLNF